MNLFQLENSIKFLQKKKSSSLFGYRPFLGVSNFDAGKCLLFDKRENIQSWCKKFKEEGKLYFFIANASTSNQKYGTHWFLIAFESDEKNSLYVFNSYGICNTLKTFGYVNKDNKEIQDNYSNSYERINAVLELSDSIWERDCSSRILPKIIDSNGVHQDFSTDECGYHVMRFVIYLYNSVFPLYSRNRNKKTNWHSILSRYILQHKINLINYNLNKYLNKSETQPILLDNDQQVIRFIENDNNQVHKSETILYHDEYNLSEREWKKYALSYKRIFQELVSNVEKWTTTIDRRSLTCEIQPLKMANKNQTAKILSRKKRLLRKKPYNIFKTGKSERILTTYADTFKDMVEKTNKSLSKKILNNLFPQQRRRCDPITNSIEYSGMVDNPQYLNNTVISLPGEEHCPLSVNEYFMSLGIRLDDKDPYTYTLCKSIKNYFENHPQKQTAHQLFKRIQKDNCKRWRFVR